MLEFNNISKSYKSGMFGTILTSAVNQVSFKIEPGQRIGLLGESGCGKSTISRLATRLLTPTEGEIIFKGKDINKMSATEEKAFHQKVQIIFQNPQQAFNPRMKLYDVIAEPLRLYHICNNKEEEKAMIRDYMSRMGLSDEILIRYPHEISGGQAQRVAIMRIIMLNPDLIIADEPTTMLDVSVQAQILQMMREIMEQNNTALLFVSHDLDVIRAMCDSIMVMKDGKILECNSCNNIFENPRDEYTRFLVGKG